MRYLFLFCCFVLGLYGTAQTPSDPQLVDVVEVKGEPDLSGTLIGYDYGVSVTIVTTVGEVVTVGWQRVRRVIIQGETVRPTEEELPWMLTDTLEVLPERSFRHQLLITTGISRERNQNFNNFFGDSPVAVLGPGINYHFVYATGKLLVGPGVGYEVMSVRRGERLVSLTALAEYQLSRRRVRPFGRLLAGTNLPFAGDRLDIQKRKLGHTIHPSVGLVLGAPVGRLVELSFDVGYRFSTVHFTALTPNLEVVDRQIGYRRFTFGMGARF